MVTVAMTSHTIPTGECLTLSHTVQKVEEMSVSLDRRVGRVGRGDCEEMVAGWTEARGRSVNSLIPSQYKANAAGITFCGM